MSPTEAPKDRFRVYLAAPLFSQTERAWNRGLAKIIEEEIPGTRMILPQDFRTEGKYNDRRRYSQLFRRLVVELRRVDALVAVLDGSDVDSGTAFEMGVAYAENIPIIGLRTDYRPGAEHGVNLMCARSCSYIAREFSFQEDPRAAGISVARRLRKILNRKK